MDLKPIQQIVEMMKDHDLTDFEIEEEGLRISLKRNNGRIEGAPSHTIVAPPVSSLAGVQVAETATSPGELSVANPVEESKTAGDGANQITSPMVGTFYLASAPEVDPFVRIGSEVTEDTIVCIIEAMKVMNEIKAEKYGVIKKVLVDNGAPVQFGDPLFVVAPS